MRRFEFVQGTSAKFWMPSVEGTTFIVVFGRLGSDGQRKEKAFPTEDAARRELDKKIAEKLREGYQEVAAATGAAPAPAAPKAPKGAAAAAPRLALPPRVKSEGALRDVDVKRAAEALRTLGKTLGGKHRSFFIAHLARRARRALERIAGADPAADPELAQSFDALMAHVGAPPRSRLPLRLAMPLLLELDTAAFGRALALWQKQPAAPPAVTVLTRELETLADPELTLRLGALLCARPERDVSPEPAWTRRWRALQPHLEAHLIASGTTLKAHVQKLDAAGDTALAARLARLR